MAHLPNRAQANGAARVFQKLFPDPKMRCRAGEILAASIEAAHATDAANWGVTLAANSIRLNVGRGAALSLAKNRVSALCDGRLLPKNAPREVTLESGRLQTAPHAVRASFEAVKIGEVWPILEASHLAFVADAARGFASRAPRSPTWRDAHSPAVTRFLSAELEREIPSPSYALLEDLEVTSRETASETSLPELLQSAMRARGLQFAPRHLAAFFTALSAKGLVILSGPSGVGKTALATAFAALLPHSGELENSIRLPKSEVEVGRLPLPASVLRYHALPEHGASRAATLICDGAAHAAKLVGDGAGGAHLQVRGAARKWLVAHQNSAWCLETAWDDEAAKPAFELLEAPLRASAGNHLFLPVRPDWRDEKPLLGYFNPLANRYEWTPFLRFLLQADAGFRAENGLAYFVILDEMNLARAEWYFADLLSILEAGRDQSGRARQPLRFDFDARATGELPPRELFLPPNLYFVGTINADESAQSLSPKVLDRAWVVDAPRPDFRAYAPQKSRADFELNGAQKRRIAAQFTRAGRFAVADQALVAAQLETHPARREDLAALNDALEVSGTGFGFRVFDEILLFCALAAQNGLFADENEAFDCAVALKIAPRFRGARGQAEAPLRALQSWSDARRLPQSAQAARRLLAQIERDGFLP
ncbi:MAG: hypothetical protein KY445_15120 [Armatimonadetes bacterium]|nr:hypothetical protein [Armatimonadota bacterium]